MAPRSRIPTLGGTLVALVGILTPALATPALGQTPGASDLRASLHAGASSYDLSGTGTAPAAALRGRYSLNSVISVEGSLGWSRPEQQFQSGPNSLWTPELQVQFAIPGTVSPYLGVGGGIAFETGREIRPRRGTTRVTASGSAGFRIRVAERWEVIPELRVRGLGEVFQGSTAEWTLGVSRSF